MKNIPQEQIIRRLREDNPWWDAADIPRPFREWKARAYLDLLMPLIRDRATRRAVVLMGPRRVGKTVLLHHVIQTLMKGEKIDPRRLCCVSVDHPLYNGLGLEDFYDLFLQAADLDRDDDDLWVFFDEVQYLKDWEIHLKALVDRRPNVKWIVSGSAAAALKLKSAESGAGRFTEFLLPPLTFYEFLVFREREDLVIFEEDRKDLPTTEEMETLNREFLAYLNHGGYPEAVFSPVVREDPQRYIKSDIIDKVLLRDLPGLYGIQDIPELNYLFTTLAFNTADELSLEELSKNSGASKNTIRKYLEYLEAAFLIRVVHGVDRSARRFQRARRFKVYLTNTTIRSALFAPVDAEDGAMGGLVETAIFAQWFHRADTPYYARWKGGEVDLVRLRADQKVEWALEAKWSDRFFNKPGELKSLLQFCRDNRLTKAWVTSRTKSGTRTLQDVELRFLPASLYCFAVGYWGIRQRGQAWGTESSALSGL